MKKEDIFTFEDFLNDSKIPSNKPNKVEKVEKIAESTEIEEEEAEVELPEVEEEIELPEEEEIETPTIEENYYPLYKDKSETFSCDIYVEGAKTDETVTRLIVESSDWTLMFPGEIKNGKVVIPIRKLNLFEEGQTGKVRLEVIAEGSVFIPWEDTFKIKMSKKVTVSLNETKKVIPTKRPEVGVKVKIKR